MTGTRNHFVSTFTLLALFTAAAAGCGTSSAPPPGSTSVQLGSPTQDGALGDRSTMTITNEASSGAKEIGAELSAVWTGLQNVLTDLELPVSQVDASAGRLQVSGRLPRIDGKRMSYWFDCGRSMTGPVADRSSIELAMAIQLRATATGTTLVEHTTRASATPRDNPGNALACTPTGRLEAFIVEAVAERVAGAD